MLKLFSNHIGVDKDFKDVTREQVLEFLNQRKNSVEDNSDKKWIRTWNDYLARLIGFYRWLYNQESNKGRSEWETPEPFNSIKKKKNKRYSGYSLNYVWSQEELLLAVKYCDNIRDKSIMTMCWDMAGRNHEIVRIKISQIVILISGEEDNSAIEFVKDIGDYVNLVFERIHKFNSFPETPYRNPCYFLRVCLYSIGLIPETAFSNFSCLHAPATRSARDTR